MREYSIRFLSLHQYTFTMSEFWCFTWLPPICFCLLAFFGYATGTFCNQLCTSSCSWVAIFASSSSYIPWSCSLCAIAFMCTVWLAVFGLTLQMLQIFLVRCISVTLIADVRMHKKLALVSWKFADHLGDLSEWIMLVEHRDYASCVGWGFVVEIGEAGWQEYPGAWSGMAKVWDHWRITIIGGAKANPDLPRKYAIQIVFKYVLLQKFPANFLLIFIIFRNKVVIDTIKNTGKTSVFWQFGW